MPTVHCERAAEGLPLFADDPLGQQPEMESSYSTFGWILVSAAVEAAGNQRFYDFMRTQIFEPLAMRDTTSDSATDAKSDQATFYYPRLSGDPAFGPEPATPVDYSCFAGAGGFISTPSDLARFALALNNGKLLKPATVTIIQTRQELLSGDETDFGLGWSIESVGLAGDQTLMVSSASRTLLGSSVSYLLFPERDLVVAAMSNISYAQLRGPALQIAEIFAQQLEKKPH
jgi:serine beta-lactamase-like protein LACTB, mitochondrial